MKRKKYFVLVGLLSLGAVTFLGGCSTILLFDPKGPIGESERFVIIAAIVLMLIVLIPVFIMAFWFPRKYRASNTASTYHAEMELFRENRFGHVGGSHRHCHGSGDAGLDQDPCSGSL